MERGERIEVAPDGTLRIRGSVSGLSLTRALELARQAYGEGNETRAWHVSPRVTRSRQLMDSFWSLASYVDVAGELTILGLPVEVDPALPDGVFELRERL